MSDITYNIDIFPDFSVSSLLIRFTDDTFDPDIGPTIGKR